MALEQIQSPLLAARKLAANGDFDTALSEAERAVDQFWKYGDPRITEALPLLCLIRHQNGINGDLFDSLEDMPTFLSDRLLANAQSIHQQRQDACSQHMLDDVNQFLDRWVGRSRSGGENPSSSGVSDEKLAELISQIEHYNLQRKRDLAVATSLELANEYAVRGENRRAFKLFVQVLRKSKKRGRTGLRIDALIDFGQFMSQMGKLDDAERAFRLASGVAKNARDEKRFAHALASLGVVMMHSGHVETARRFLKKAQTLLNPWDADSDIVGEHLDAIEEGVACDCPQAKNELSFSGTGWE